MFSFKYVVTQGRYRKYACLQRYPGRIPNVVRVHTRYVRAYYTNGRQWSYLLARNTKRLHRLRIALTNTGKHDRRRGPDGSSRRRWRLHGWSWQSPGKSNYAWVGPSCAWRDFAFVVGSWTNSPVNQGRPHTRPAAAFRVGAERVGADILYGWSSIICRFLTKLNALSYSPHAAGHRF